MHRSTLFALSLVAMALVAAGTATQTDSRPRPAAVNLVAADGVRRELRAAFLRARRQRPARVEGPLPGTLYYARFGSTYWALASFSVPFFRAQGQPTVFRHARGRRWRAISDTGGSICPSLVPLPVIKVWSLRPDGGGCYGVPPP